MLMSFNLNKGTYYIDGHKGYLRLYRNNDSLKPQKKMT